MADKNAAERADRYREQNLLERLPDTRALDAAVSAGLAAWIEFRFQGDPEKLRTDKSMRHLFTEIETALERHGVDARHPISRSRLKSRLRIAHVKQRRTTI